jgi:hypothetical protein
MFLMWHESYGESFGGISHETLFFIGFWNLRVSITLLIMMLDTPSDRARRAASTDVSFARGTDRGSNISAECFFCSLFPIEKNHIFINI